MNIAYTLHRGKVCRQQQDGLLIDGAIYQAAALPVTALTLEKDELLVAVADGVAASGGDRRIAPQQAIRIALEELVQAVRDHPEWLQEGLVANRHLRRAQARLAERLAGNPRTCGAATTLALVHLKGRRAAVLNVGDSRVYGASRAGQWRRLSKDHTVLQDLIDRDEASPDIAYASLYQALAHALCADPEETDFAIHRARVAPAPGDTLILCSDGVHDELGEERMRALFDPALDVAAQVKVWRDAVWRKGAHDNLSLIVMRL
ncbi:MAG: protein phosphatase 2C domain-containing protein [Candidatus Competibacteraceae bacterium]|nr:protein phosphatase 2C domain-containing protein [Candidatus Competibacteraceae bacterium]